MITLLDRPRTVLSEPTYYIRPGPHKEPFDSKHPIIQNVHSRFDLSGFEKIHRPLVIGQVYDTAKFSYPNNFPDGLCVIDLPIKTAMGAVYRIPKELDQFSETIRRIVSFEHAINAYNGQCYAYLTVLQGIVHSGKFQRTDGSCFVDGLRAEMIKRPIARSYTIYDRVPDVFYCQKFDVSGVKWVHECKGADQKIGIRYHGLFGDVGTFPALLNEQAVEETAIDFERYSIIANDIYSVCRETTVDYPVFRTFFKLTFDTVKKDAVG
jgi:hypothetical protein